MKPLTIVISFDVNEQIAPCGLPGPVASLMHEFGFDRAKAAFHRGIALRRLLHRASLDGASNRLRPTISLPAHGLDHPGCIKDLTVISGRILAIGMMDEATRRLLPLDGHGQGGNEEFHPHVITHRPANDLSGEKIEHDSQIEPAFLG